MPTLTVIAGPNGSGKSTLTQSFEFEGSDRLLDPDAIARGMNPLNPSAAAVAQLMRKRVSLNYATFPEPHLGKAQAGQLQESAQFRLTRFSRRVFP